MYKKSDAWQKIAAKATGMEAEGLYREALILWSETLPLATSNNEMKLTLNALKRCSANRHYKGNKVISINRIPATLNGEYQYETG